MAPADTKDDLDPKWSAAATVSLELSQADEAAVDDFLDQLESDATDHTPEALVTGVKAYFVSGGYAVKSVSKAAASVLVGLMWSEFILHFWRAIFDCHTKAEKADSDYVGVCLVSFASVWLVKTVVAYKVISKLPEDHWGKELLSGSMAHTIGFRLLALGQGVYYWSDIWQIYSHKKGHECGLTRNSAAEYFYGYNSAEITTGFTYKTGSVEANGICVFPKLELEAEEYRMFDQDKWGEVFAHYMLGIAIAFAVILPITMIFRRLRKFAQKEVDEELEEVMSEIEADMNGVVFGALIAQALWFFVLGFCCVLTDYFHNDAMVNTPDVVSVLAVSYVSIHFVSQMFVWLPTSHECCKHLECIFPTKLIEATFSFTIAYFTVDWVTYLCDLMTGAEMNYTHFLLGHLKGEEYEFKKADELFQVRNEHGFAGPFIVILVTYGYGVLHMAYGYLELMAHKRHGVRVNTILQALASHKYDIDEPTQLASKRQAQHVGSQCLKGIAQVSASCTGTGAAVAIALERWATALVGTSEEYNDDEWVRVGVFGSITLGITIVVYFMLYLRGICCTSSERDGAKDGRKDILRPLGFVALDRKKTCQPGVPTSPVRDDQTPPC